MSQPYEQVDCSIDFIINCLESVDCNHIGHQPLIVGLNGAQGSGKTTLVSEVAERLRRPPHSLSTIVLSIDDFYLAHQLQLELATAHPSNPLIQHRGQPSTHDLPLALSLFSDLRTAKETRIPSYDKSAFMGKGDRTPKDTWQVVNHDGQPTATLIIFEGWCVGFRALSVEELRRKWGEAVTQKQEGNYQGQLGNNKFEDVEFVNEALKNYDQLTDQLDALIHLDAADPLFVYRWREEQERKLRSTKGSGMSDKQVKDFVDGYYPAYELYTDRLRAGIFDRANNKQLRLVLDEERKIKSLLLI